MVCLRILGGVGQESLREAGMLCLWQRREGDKSVGGKHVQPLAEDCGGKQMTFSHACIQDVVTVLKRVLYFIHIFLPAYIHTHILTYIQTDRGICIHMYRHTYIHT